MDKPDFNPGEAFNYKYNIKLKKSPDIGGRESALRASSEGMSVAQRNALAADRAGEIQQLEYKKLLGQASPEELRRLETAKNTAKAVLNDGENIKPLRNLLSGNVGKAAPYELSVLEKFIRPAGGAIAGAVEAIPPINKYLDKEPTASMAEAALSPEGSKGIARGVGAVAGMEAGAELGAMSPVLKGPATLAGAVGGSMAGAKLAEMLTGVPAVDALIRKAYEKQLREREAEMMAETESSSYLKNPRMADAAPRNMELRSGQ